MPHKLLLADDSVTIQRVIELTFADEHIQVIAVGDGQQAIARIEAERPDVVLADIGMPEKDGYEVASFVKSQAHLQHIPVLLLTGAFEPVDEARAHAIGCDGVLVKPFEPQMVINRVRDLLAGRQPQSLWATPPEQPATPVERAAGPSAPPPAARPDYKALAAPAEADETPASAESLDDYFDRLDAAFSSFGAEGAQAAPEPAPAPPVPEPPVTPVEPASDRFEPAKASARDGAFSETLERWDPSLSDERPAAPAPAGSWLQDESRAAPPERPVAAPPPPAPAAEPPAPAPRAPAPSLSDAFAALLAAEAAQAGAPARAAAPAPPAPVAPPVAVNEELIETIVRRVVERMTAAAVQDQVLQVAERLVREEIARIKNAAH